MLKKLRNRFVIGFMLIVVVFISVTVQLSNLTLAQGDELTVKSEDKKVRKVTLKGARGQILDVTGIPLAYDQISYDVAFTKDPSKNTNTDKAYYTDVLIRTIKMVEENDGEIIDTFAIVRGADGMFWFDFGDISSEAHDKRVENWRKNMFVSKTAAPDVIYRDLRTRYRIPEEYTYEQARKLLSIWQEIQLSSYRAYVPVKIATDIPMETVAVLEVHSTELDGISVAESSTRVYPKDDVAAHIIGYMSKMTNEETVKEMQGKGYSQDDTIGASGIESTMETELTGNASVRQGQREVEVNSKGKVIKEISYTPPTNGNNVMLTMNLDLQMMAEQALKENVEWVYEEQLKKYEENPSKYDNAESLKNRTGDTTLEKMNLAKSGALVVMDVKTGNILAMTSYPSYDLNLFEGGIADKDYKPLLDDPATPLFNKAIASKGIPGSIFKMVTGMAGLAEGVITPNTVINDEGPFDKYLNESYIVSGGKAPACWAYPLSYENHQNNQTITDAVKVSCNYFFFSVADQLKIDHLVNWSDRFGLTTKTNIELPGEVAGQVGCQETLYDWTKPLAEQKASLPQLVRNQIIGFLGTYGEQRNVVYQKELLEETADELMKLVEVGAQRQSETGNFEIGPEIRSILAEKMDIPETITKRNAWDNDIATALRQLVWNPTRTVLTGIGTDLTMVTPIAVARYIASLVNGGYVYDAQIVDSIIDAHGNIVQERQSEVYTKIDATEESFMAIKEGMREVVSAEDGGLAAGMFDGWKYKNTSEKNWIGGKTGTGKVVNDVDIENNAWFVAFAPYDDPEIAVVSYIPNGIGGTYAIPSARDVIGYYLDGKTEETDTQIPTYNSLLP